LFTLALSGADAFEDRLRRITVFDGSDGIVKLPFDP